MRANEVIPIPIFSFDIIIHDAYDVEGFAGRHETDTTLTVGAVDCCTRAS